MEVSENKSLITMSNEMAKGKLSFNQINEIRLLLVAMAQIQKVMIRP